MSALWVVCLLCLFDDAVPVVRADDSPFQLGMVPATFLPQESQEAHSEFHELLLPGPFEWYGELNIVYLDRTLSDMRFATNLGAIQQLGGNGSFFDVNPADNRSINSGDLDMNPQPGLRFLVGRTIWADPCDDRGCVAKPNDTPEPMRRLSIELGYLGLLQQHRATLTAASNPATPNGAIVSRFANTGMNNSYNPVLWPFDQANLNTLTYRSRFDSAELNLRYSTGASRRMPIDVLAGVRYMKLQENLDYLAYNNNPQLPGLLNASPLGMYSTRTDNDLIGLQVGGDLSYRLSSDWSLMGRGRGGLLVNSASQRSNVNGTMLASSNPYSDTGYGSGVGMAGLFEFGIHTNYQLSSNLSLMIGYQGLFLSDLSTAPRQYNWNTDLGSRNNLDRNGNLFFFGPAAGIQWRW